MNKKSLFHISKRDTLPWYTNVAIRGGAIILALVVCALVTTILTGENPLSIYGTILKGAFGTARKSWTTWENVAILLGISLAAFLLGRIAPGDPVDDALFRIGIEFPTEGDRAEMRARLGLDQPLPAQYFSWLGRALRGDLGRSYIGNRDIAQELKLGNYDAVVCAPDQKALQLLGGYESMPLLKDAVIFVHGNIGQEDADYNLSSETLRGIYAGTAPLFWDEAQTQPLIPAYGYANDAQDPLWQLMSMQFGFTADAPDILTRGTWDNPVWATVETGRVGSPLFPLHYNWLFGEAGINGSVISVDGVRPTDATLADGSYPFTLSYYGLYSPSHPQAQQIIAILQGVQAMQSAD